MTQTPSVHAVLEAEHKWIDERFGQFQRDLEADRTDPRPFEEATRKLHRHIYLEEELLFPRVETRGLAGPIVLMAQEHGEICRQLTVVGDLLASGAEPSRIRKAFGTLLVLLAEHNAKEEQILYPASDQLLTEQELAEMVPQLEEAEAPEGWLCRAHRGSEA